MFWEFYIFSNTTPPQYKIIQNMTIKQYIIEVEVQYIATFGANNTPIYS